MAEIKKKANVNTKKTNNKKNIIKSNNKENIKNNNKENIKSNINTLKILISIGIILILWCQTETFILTEESAFLVILKSYFIVPSIYSILIAFGYLSFYDLIPWKEYKRFLIFFLLFNFLSTLFFLDYNNPDPKAEFIHYLKIFTYEFGKWIIWVILLGTLLVKMLKSSNNEKKLTIILISIGTVIFIALLIINIFFFLDYSYIYESGLKQYLLANIDSDEKDIFKIIPGILCFIIGIFLNFKSNYLKKSWLMYMAIFIFITILITRVNFEFPIFYFDILEITQFLCLTIPFLFIKNKNHYFFNFLFNGSVLTIFIAPIITSLTSIETLFDTILKNWFQVDYGHNIDEFVKSHIVFSLFMALIKEVVIILLISLLTKYLIKRILKITNDPLIINAIKKTLNDKINIFDDDE